VPASSLGECNGVACASNLESEDGRADELDAARGRMGNSLELVVVGRSSGGSVLISRAFGSVGSDEDEVNSASSGVFLSEELRRRLEEELDWLQSSTSSM